MAEGQGEDVFTMSWTLDQTDPPSTIAGVTQGLAVFLGATAFLEGVEYHPTRRNEIVKFRYTAWRNLTPEMIYDVQFRFSGNPPPTPVKSTAPAESDYTFGGGPPINTMYQQETPSLTNLGGKNQSEGAWVVDPASGKRGWMVNGIIIKWEDLPEADAVDPTTAPDYIPPDDPSKDGWVFIGSRQAYFKNGHFVIWEDQQLPPPPGPTTLEESTPRTMPTDIESVEPETTEPEAEPQPQTHYSREHQRWYAVNPDGSTAWLP